MTTFLNNKLLVVFLIPFFLGVLTIFGFSPYKLTFINFFTFSFLLFLIFLVKKRTQIKYRKKKSDRYFFYLGCSFGFGFFLFGNYWISISLTHDEQFKSLIPFAFVLIPLFLSTFFGLAIFLIGRFCEKKIYFILFFSIIFSIFEFLRGNLFSGFPWNLISYTWSWSVETIQILSLIGTYSLSLVSLTFFCAPFIFFQKNSMKKNTYFTLILLFIFSINFLYGNYKLKNDIYNFDEKINVKIISPNLTLKEFSQKSELDILKRLIRISDPQKDKKTLFIWPEGIFYESNLQNIILYQDLFLEKFSENHLIIMGINNYVHFDNDNDKKYFNSLVVLNHKLEIISYYNKLNLVPFGEFLPFENILAKLGFKKITSGYSSFSPGDKRQLINLGESFNENTILPLICYEIIYSGGIKRSDEKPDLVINISEDAWFGDSIGPYQHYDKAIFRSVEEGVFIARAANKGFSGFIDPNGKSIKFLERSESGNVEFKMPEFYKPTLFSKYGNKIFFLMILLYIFLSLILKKFKI